MLLSSAEEDNNMYDVIQSADTPSPDKNLINESLAYEIERALSTLSPRESKVLEVIFRIGNETSLYTRGNRRGVEPHPGTCKTNKGKSNKKNPVYYTLQDT